MNYLQLLGEFLCGGVCNCTNHVHMHHSNIYQHGLELFECLTSNAVLCMLIFLLISYFLLLTSNYCFLSMADGHYIATVSHDRTIKLWSSSSHEKERAMDVDCC